jgi:hypothetical protein
MMKKLLIISLSLLPVLALACPGCNDDFSSVNNSVQPPPYNFMILGGFIVSTYVPFYLLFRAAKKYEPKDTDGNS